MKTQTDTQETETPPIADTPGAARAASEGAFTIAPDWGEPEAHPIVIGEWKIVDD